MQQKPPKHFLFNQNTKEWHDWRDQGLGASDAPVILGYDPYGKTPHTLYLEKTKQAQPKPFPDFLRELGREVEAKARAHFEILNDKACPPMCLEMADYPFIKASLDGYNSTDNFILEIKAVGAKQFQEEQPPIHHWAQLQHQMMVANATDVTYLRGWKNKRTLEVHMAPPMLIQRNDEFIEKMLEAEIKFWEMVKQFKAPPKESEMIL